MYLLDLEHQIETELDGEAILQRIEKAGRVCYKSEHRITPTSARKFVAALIRRGHHSVLEHEGMTVRFVCDRGLSHEIVRHRIASYSQESTRYCNYGRGEIALIPMLNGLTGEQIHARKELYEHIERVYKAEIAEGVTPQQARDNLPTCLKTEVVMTANFREWRHFFALRTTSAAHPQIRALVRPLLWEMRERVPVLFDDVGELGE